MLLMCGLGAVLVVGFVLTVRWGAVAYRPGRPLFDSPPPPVAAVTSRYGRAVAIAMVGGFWAGAAVTGPAIRLIMRLLAVTAGDDAQGRITEADQVVGEISSGGTIGLIVFGAVLPGLVSGLAYVVVRPLLPRRWWAGVTFGMLHLVLLATIVDPLRPENPDFDLVGPGWLSLLTFGLASVLHGMAVVAFANRYSRQLPADADGHDVLRAGLPLVLPAVFVVVFFIGIAALAVGLLLVLVVSRIPLPPLTPSRARATVLAGRVALGIVVLVATPGTVTGLVDIIDRESAPAQSEFPRTSSPHRVPPISNGATLRSCT